MVPVRGRRNFEPRGATRSIEPLEDRVLFAAFVVTNTADSGAGSLRQAILSANATPGLDTISFAIGSGAKSIAPLSALPTIKDRLVLDATTQPGYSNRPLVEVTGSRLPAGNTTSGLTVTAGGSTVRGLVINRFGGNGVMLLTNGGNTVGGNYIGTNASGTAAAPNGGQGVLVQCAGNVIGGSTTSGRNVISGNAKNGIQLYTTAASSNSVRGNFIGTNSAGTAAVANTKCGISVAGAGNTIGGTSSAVRNVISGNGADGVLIAGSGATGNKVQGNYVGTNSAGAAKLGNALYGVEISQPNNTVGGTVSAARNVISGNVKSGVVLYLASATGNVVQGNYIGTDATGKLDLGNGARGVDITNGPTGNLIGGATAGARNVISGNDAGGVGIYSTSARNTVSGNFVGTDASGLVGLGNTGAGVIVTAAAGGGNVIGGSGAAAQNVISANTGEGVRVGDVSGTRIEYNLIGTDRLVTGRLPNRAAAVSLVGATSTVVRSNTIFYSGARAVQLVSTSANTITSNTLRSVLA
jgi:parallel beta-helix repeat protein